jgi:chromosome segregation ATPase
MAAASSNQAASTESRDPQFSGTMLAGDLHVMMDVGLADELGMSVQDLKGSIGKVATLHSKTEVLETTSSNTKKLATSTAERLTEFQKEMELKNSQLKEEAEKKLREEIEKKNVQLADMKKELEDQRTQLMKDAKIAEEKLKEEIEKNFSRLKEDMEKQKVDFEKEIENRNEQLEETKEEMALYKEGLDSLKSRFDDQGKDEAEELENEEEPGIALEDQLRIIEQSAKAIDLLTNHLFSTVWQTCSKNTFGNENI